MPTSKALTAVIFLDEINDFNGPMILIPGSQTTDWSEITALFVMSGIAIICFNVLNFNKINMVYRSILQNPLLFLMMSSALGIDWFCMIYATYLSDPFITMTSLFTSSALLGFLKLYREKGSQSYSWGHYTSLQCYLASR